MIDQYAAQMAEVLTNYSAPIKKGDYVVISGTVEAAPLIDALQAAVLERGGHPAILVNLPNSPEIHLQYANDEQLAYSDPMTEFMFEKMDVIFRILSTINTKSAAQVNPSRLAIAQQAARKPMEIYRRRRDAEEFQWCVCPWPTVSMAQDAEMGLLAYRRFIYEACGLNQADPVAYWQSFKERQTRYVDWLKGKKRVEVRGPGIDMSFNMDGRLWVSAHGTVNFPDGEIFTGPIEDSVNGIVEFSYPSVYQGREVDGVKLEFKDGKVINASAKKGEDFLMMKLDTDEGARFLGEFAIGTNNGIQQFTRNILFDEKIGGTIHMALGQSYAETNAVNQSLVHWDMVHDMKDGGEILVDGDVLYRNGEFVI